MLGYFSIICLLRVHVLLGDFTLALKVMENVELSQKVHLTIPSIQHPSNFLTGTIDEGDCLPCFHLLLRRILLHSSSPLP